METSYKKLKNRIAELEKDNQSLAEKLSIVVISPGSLEAEEIKIEVKFQHEQEKRLFFGTRKEGPFTCGGIIDQLINAPVMIVPESGRPPFWQPINEAFKERPE
jgi:hypothetical protein